MVMMAYLDSTEGRFSAFLLSRSELVEVQPSMDLGGSEKQSLGTKLTRNWKNLALSGRPAKKVTKFRTQSLVRKRFSCPRSFNTIPRRQVIGFQLREMSTMQPH